MIPGCLIFLAKQPTEHTAFESQTHLIAWELEGGNSLRRWTDPSYIWQRIECGLSFTTKAMPASLRTISVRVVVIISSDSISVVSDSIRVVIH